MLRSIRVSIIYSAIVCSLISQPATADTVGSHRQAQANHRCAALGERFERGGLTERERALMAHRECKRAKAGTWSSTRVFSQ